MTKKKYFAVFGDTHCHLRLMFQLCRLWQMNHEIHLDGIFQCGDLGYFPNPYNLDNATKQYSLKDPEELGFKYFTKPEPYILDDKLTEIITGSDQGFSNVKCPVYFCHGNHEDFEYLKSEVTNSDFKAIDYYKKLIWLKPGYLHQMEKMSLVAIGGAPELSDESKNNYKTKEDWKYVYRNACLKIRGRKFDILLSHASPKGIGGESDTWGSSYLRLVIEACQPQYHFFAHHTRKVMPNSIGNTKCFWLKDVNFFKMKKGINSPVEEDCMGILSWEDPSNHEFQFVNDKWMKKVTFSNWWKL
jgi:hypothetical protein